jgi:NhaP-type Na+/H+ or K+/H+ antiporter
MAPALYVAACVLLFALFQRRLAPTPVTGPMIFVGFGVLAGASALDLIPAGSVETTLVVDTVFQATLVLLLFTDAASLNVSSWRRESLLPGRLLGIGLPLTILLGTIVAALVFPALDLWEAAIIAAVLSPTDAALGQAVISNTRVPARIRHAVDVESGLNDGISLPFVLVFIGLAEEEARTGVVSTFLIQIGVALAVGITVGVVAGILLVWARSAGYMGEAWSSIAVVAVAALAFTGATLLGGSGFIATFVAGFFFGSMTGGSMSRCEELASDLGEALVPVSFLLFGALILEPHLEHITWQVVLMAVLALTIVRMAPVALSLVGSGSRWPTVLYVGWFGPRGLATIVFTALVVVESDLPGEGTITLVASTTVLLSVVLHGVTAYPGSERYATWAEKSRTVADLTEMRPVTGTRMRSRTTRTDGS